MERSILLRGARQLLTLRGPGGARRGSQMSTLNAIDDGALLIVDGVIRDVGPSRRVENLAAARGAVEISANGRVVMPGFVDCRTHLVSGPPLLNDYEARIGGAGEEEIEAAGGGRGALLRAIRNSTRPRLEMIARAQLRRLIRHGTTTLEAHSGLGSDDKSELKILRALSGAGERALDLLTTYFGAVAVAPDFEGPPEDYLRHLMSYTLPKIKRLKLAHFADIVVGGEGFEAAPAAEYLRRARGLGFIPRVTVGEGTGAAAKAVEVAVREGATSVDRFQRIGEAEAAVLANVETVATLLPGESFHRREGCYPDARRLIEAGAAVAVASGYSSDRSPSCNMAAILSLACNGMGLNPAEAITAGTINAAHALACGERIGSLESGKQADLIMLDVPDYREIPYHFGMNLVAMMMKRGDVIYPRMEFPWASR